MLLRFRKGDGESPGYPSGDLGRIKTQQEFLKAAVARLGESSFSDKTIIAGAIYWQADTNLPADQALSWITRMKNKTGVWKMFSPTDFHPRYLKRLKRSCFPSQ